MTGPPAIRIEIKKSFFFFLRPRCRVIVSPRAKLDGGRFDRSKEEKEYETRPTSTASFVLPARRRHGNSAALSMFLLIFPAKIIPLSPP